MLTLTSAVAQTVGAALAILPARVPTRSTRLSRSERKAVLTVHFVASVSWMAIIAVQAVQAVLSAAARSAERDAMMLRSLYEAQYAIDELFLGKISFLVLFSGLVLELATPWGLWRHRWIVVKFAITLTVMALPLLTYKATLDRGYAMLLDGRAAEEINDALGVVGMLPGLGISPLLVLLAAILSMYKPWGPTRFAQRTRTVRSSRAVASQGRS